MLIMENLENKKFLRRKYKSLADAALRAAIHNALWTFSNHFFSAMFICF